jgi:hypothetical protein
MAGKFARQATPQFLHSKHFGRFPCIQNGSGLRHFAMFLIVLEAGLSGLQGLVWEGKHGCADSHLNHRGLHAGVSFAFCNQRGAL